MANPEHAKVLMQAIQAQTTWNEWREHNPSITPDLSGIRLVEASLRSAEFSRANLSDAYLVGAHLGGADLSGARLAGAHIEGADLTAVDLSGADLSGAHLFNTIFNHAHLSGATFSKATVRWTIFGDTDLSDVKGLESVIHYGPSTVGVDTIYKSGGNISNRFLRGCGVPDEFMTYAHSLVTKGIDFYSCFISYYSKDQLFADRLYADLQNKGVRCWLASEDLKIGEKIRVGIDESIRFHDKLLLVLSKHSVASDWVEQEVETALARERKEKRTVLFPIRLDDSVMKVESGWPALVRNARNIGDFRKWKQHDSYQKAFDRLLRDLKAGA